MAAPRGAARARSPDDVFGRAATGMAVIGPAGHWERVNEALCRLLGRSEADLVGAPCLDILHPEDRTIPVAPLRQMIRGELDQWQSAIRLVRGDGSVLWAHVTVVPSSHYRGGRLFAQLQDIGAQMAAQVGRWESQQWLRAVVSRAPVAIVALDLTGHVLLVEGSPAQTAATRERSIVGGPSVFETYADTPLLVDAYRRAVAGTSSTYTTHVDDHVYDSTIGPMLDEDGVISYVVNVSTDVTERARISSQQAVVAELGRRALERPDLARLQAHTTSVVAAELGVELCALYQVEGRDLRLVAGVGIDPGLVGSVVIPPEARTPAHAALATGISQRVLDLPTEDRVSAPWVVTHAVVSGVAVLVGRTGHGIGVLSAYSREARVFTDQEVAFLEQVAYVLGAATQRLRDEESIRHRAMHDELTELPNRTLLLDRLGVSLARERRRPGAVTVVFVDLDGFKAVNDLLGHEAGDLLLRTVGGRLQGVVRPADTVARLAGDEFAVMCEDLGGPREAVDLARRILAAVSVPVALQGREFSVTASVGLAISAHDSRRPETLLRDADLAMYAAKRQGKGRYELFDQVMRARVARRVAIEDDLRRALDAGELRLAYQPIVTLGGDLVGVEALMRWNHPRCGPINPSEFVPMAEEAGLIVPLGTWALREACGVASRFSGNLAGRAPLRMAVNVSVRQLADPSFVDVVAAALAETRHGRPFRLCVEITESAMMESVDDVTRIVAELHGLGVLVAIDDFGTGYSSLSHLQRLSVDSLKVDCDFVAGLGRNPADGAIVEAVIGLGRTLGLQTVAEGVETAAQLAALRRLRCDLAQGHYLAPPEIPLADRDPPTRWVPGAAPWAAVGVAAAGAPDVGGPDVGAAAAGATAAGARAAGATAVGARADRPRARRPVS